MLVDVKIAVVRLMTVIQVLHVNSRLELHADHLRYLIPRRLSLNELRFAKEQKVFIKTFSAQIYVQEFRKQVHSRDSN